MEEKNHYKMVNFRLNLEKTEEKEVFDFLEEIDHGTLKECYGNKSSFIKRVLIEFLHHKKAAKNQNISKEEVSQIEENFYQKLEVVMRSSKEELLCALPLAIKQVLEEVLATKVQDFDFHAGSNKVGMNANESIESADRITGGIGNETIHNSVKENISAVIPEETENLPEEAMSYFLGL